MKPRELLKELTGIGLIGLAVFLLTSVASFSVNDLASHVAPVNPEPANWGGSVGAGLGGFLIRWVGTLGGLAAGLFVLHFGWSCLRRALAGVEANAELPQVEPLRRIAGGLVMVLMLAVLERVIAGNGWVVLGQGLPPGGIWGLFLEAEMAQRLGGVGGPLALTTLLLVGFVLSADRPVRELWDRSLARARDAATKARQGVVAAEAALASCSPEPALVPAQGGETQAADPAPEESARVPRELAPLHEPEAAGPKPSLELLTPAAPVTRAPDQTDERGKLIEETLGQFKLAAKVMSVERGPAVTLFALELGRGIKVQRLVGLLDNLAIALRVPGIRIQAPIPGTSWVGLEVPNEEVELVRFRELLENPAWKKKEPALPLFLGKDSAGRPLIADLAKMPHLLIAGATGSGKSVCINAIILSLLMTRSRREVQLILVDPKQVELAQFQKVPHLVHPVVTDMRQAGAVLAWAVKKMEDRYTLLARAGVRQLKEYNELGKDGLCDRLNLTVEELEKERIPWKLPYLVLVVDELNDLMMIAQKEVEASITRLAQKSRAVGIHVVLATQRPSVDVLTGVIKSNLPARLAFRVTSKVDSRTILDMSGADKLLGHGDMLFLPPGRSQPIRALGALVTDKEIRSVVKAVARAAKPEFEDELVACTEAAKNGDVAGATNSVDPNDPTYLDAVRVVLSNQKGSVSLIQRKLGIGYGRAARLLDHMAEAGLVGPSKGSKAREVRVSLHDWERQQG